MSYWEMFVDEQKHKHKFLSIGILVLHKNTLCQLYAQMIKTRDRVQNVHGAKIGEVHWSALNVGKADLACAWLDDFFHAPMAFFAYVPNLDNYESRFDLVAEAVERFESDSCIPSGFDRRHATVHVDYDSDISMLDNVLSREFGLLRAYPWDSKGSPLLQLSDVLLGIAATESGNAPVNPESKKGSLRLKIVEHAIEENRRKSKNHVFVYHGEEGYRRLLV